MLMAERLEVGQYMKYLGSLYGTDTGGMAAMYQSLESTAEPGVTSAEAMREPQGCQPSQAGAELTGQRPFTSGADLLGFDDVPNIMLSYSLRIPRLTTAPLAQVVERRFSKSEVGSSTLPRCMIFPLFLNPKMWILQPKFSILSPNLKYSTLLRFFSALLQPEAYI